MNDRELLELAAKAVPEFEITRVGDCLYFTSGRYLARGWSPLTDDGDALRLAVKLKICIYPETGTAEWKRADDDWVANSVFDSDPYAATRRAIVRAAAQIGKAMP